MNDTNSSTNATLVDVNHSFLGSIAFPDTFFVWNVITWGIVVVYLTFSSKALAATVSFLLNKLYFRGTCGTQRSSVYPRRQSRVCRRPVCVSCRCGTAQRRSACAGRRFPCVRTAAHLNWLS